MEAKIHTGTHTGLYKLSQLRFSGIESTFKQYGAFFFKLVCVKNLQKEPHERELNSTNYSGRFERSLVNI